jgi:hypothetical protein
VGITFIFIGIGTDISATRADAARGSRALVNLICQPATPDQFFRLASAAHPQMRSNRHSVICRAGASGRSVMVGNAG